MKFILKLEKMFLKATIFDIKTNVVNNVEKTVLFQKRSKTTGLTYTL